MLEAEPERSAGIDPDSAPARERDGAPGALPGAGPLDAHGEDAVNRGTAEERLRASVLERGVLQPAPSAVRSRLTAPTLLALLLVALSAGLSLMFVLTRGALTLPAPASSDVAAAVSPSPTRLTATPPPSARGSAAATSSATRGPAATVAAGARRYAETDPAIVYSGSWGRATGSAYSGGAVAWTTEAGARAMLRFEAGRIAWYGPVGPTRGSAVVYLDGAPIATISTHATSYSARRLLFSRDLPSTGSHTIVIEAVGTSGHPMVAIDELIAGS